MLCNFFHTQVLGQVGQIMSIAPNENIEVLVEEKSWTFNPFAVTCVSRVETQDQMLTNPDTSEGSPVLYSQFPLITITVNYFLQCESRFDR